MDKSQVERSQAARAQKQERANDFFKARDVERWLLLRMRTSSSAVSSRLRSTPSLGVCAGLGQKATGLLSRALLLNGRRGRAEKRVRARAAAVYPSAEALSLYSPSSSPARSGLLRGGGAGRRFVAARGSGRAAFFYCG